MTRIAPSILSADLSDLAGAVRHVEAAGADLLHVDVMDGQFVPNITFGPGTVKALRRVTRLPLDVHLMIADPDRYLADFAAAGADIITVHCEACVHLHRTLQRIRELGVRAGVAYNPATPLSSLPLISDCVDLVLIMSVNPGFGGQKFIPAALVKVSEAARCVRQTGRDVEIEVDGGVNADNAATLANAGATMLVAGTAVFGATDMQAAIAALKAVSRTL